MANWNEYSVRADYHFKIASRMFERYGDFHDKRFLIGVINELAKSVLNLVWAFLVEAKYKRRGIRSDMQTFAEKISPIYFDEKISLDLMRILEIEQARKISPIELMKDDKIILVVGGKYKILSVERLGELLESTSKAIMIFKQI